MKIKVEKLNEFCENSTVSFSTEYGNATANWDGDLPEEGKEYFAEIEIGETFVLGTNLKLCDENKFSIGMEKESVFLTGFLESVEKDGYAVLRVGDSIVSIEIMDAIPPESFVMVISNEVTLFDVKY
ncbi:hypothetical protein [Gorillibacterium sp. sgz500922]|uniref:hypothetical protein n=1 Tax=Gorillibacterium sp. sgz500922 TaxID=3446694 RepID=UPI003F67A445